MEELAKMVQYAEEFGEPSMKKLNKMIIFDGNFIILKKNYYICKVQLKNNNNYGNKNNFLHNLKF